MQKFKLLAFLLLEILCHKKPLQKGRTHRDTIFTPWNQSKLEENQFLCLKHIFRPKIILVLFYFILLLFSGETKNSYVQFFEMSHFKNSYSNPLVNLFC